MELQGTAWGGGRGSGRTHLVEDPSAIERATLVGSILVVGAPWWPPTPWCVPAPAGAVIDRSSAGPESRSRIPLVGALPPDLFREGEPIDVDGDRGCVTLPGVREIPVVTAFLTRSDGRLLLLRRSDKVGSFRGQWAGVSGFLEDLTAELQVRREIREETGLGEDDAVLEREGRPVYARDGTTVYTVHPFRFRTERTEVRLDWEHTDSEWVDPAEILRRPTVPNLERAWRAVAPSRVPKG